MTTSIRGERENVRFMARLMIPQRPNKCHRCNYDDADPDLEVPDHFRDCYQDICEECYRHLRVLESKHRDYGDY